MARRPGHRGKGPVQQAAAGALIQVHVQPGSRAPGIGGVDPWRGALVVQVAAPAHEGKANEELTRRIAEALLVEGARVKVRSGHRSRDKSVVVEGMGAEEARRRLGVPP